VVASRHLEKYGLTVVAGLSVDEALDDYYRMRRVYVTMASTITVMLAALSAWITALIVKLLNGKEELRRLSQTDRLTDLPNRGKIVDLLDEAIAAPGAVGKVAVIFVDLDNFKDLNDTYGHQCGDEVLAMVATRLQATVQERGVVGRLGGDEFLLVLTTDAITDVVERMVTELTAALQAPLNSRWGVETVGASFGIAILNAGEDSCELIRKADFAMYQAKNRDPAYRIDSSTDRIFAG
jgi:diguanylate cyclase (GGDEF)-like protein